MSTAHSVQSRTADAAVASVGPNSKAETLYVAASRGRRNWIVGVGTPDDVTDAAKAALTRLGCQPTALEHGIRTETDAEAWVDLLPPGLAAADIKQRAIESGLSAEAATNTAGRYTRQQLTRALTWIRAQEPHQNPQQLAEVATRHWRLSPELTGPLAGVYTAQEQKRIAIEREQINQARQDLAARREQVRDIEERTSRQREELDSREDALLHQQENIDTEENQLGPLSRRLGARQRAAERERIGDELHRIEAERQPISRVEEHIRRWRKTEQEWKKPIVAWVRELPEGLDADTAHRKVVERWGLGRDAAEAVDLWEATERERARTKEIQEWWQRLDDGLTAAQVRTEAEQRWGTDVDAAEMARTYWYGQIDRVTAWVRSQPAGFTPESVAAIARFGIRPRHTERLVANHRQTALTAWANDNLPDDLPTHQAHQRITQQWGKSRYADAVWAEWHYRQQQQQEQQRQDRGRPGLSL